MSTPTEAHLGLVREVVRVAVCSGELNFAAQLLADSETRAVEAATDTAEVYRVQAQYANHQLTAERERVRVLEEALREVASFGEGEKVNGSFDEPNAARIARAALATPERKEGGR